MPRASSLGWAWRLKRPRPRGSRSLRLLGGTEFLGVRGFRVWGSFKGSFKGLLEGFL